VVVSFIDGGNRSTVFGLVQPGLEHTVAIYGTRSERANYFPNDTVETV
jgi:hypothetical protein